MRKPDSDKGKALLEESKDAKAKLHILPLDVTKSASIKECTEKVFKTCGRIDILINNAGYACIGPLEALSMDKIKAQFNTNVFGVFELTKAVLPGMRERG